MRNCEIINAVYARDKSRELARQVYSYNWELTHGNGSRTDFTRYEDIFDVLRKLDDWRYQITASDAEVLRRYNVLVSPQNSSNYVLSDKNSFVVTSDFHSCEYPLEKIKDYYLDEYDVVFILGDATDRGKDGSGTGGIKLLIDIMRLSKQYPGKVIYVPGNHDEFLLGYVRSKKHMDSYYSLDYVANLLYNGGFETINDLNRLESQDPRTFNELISWLGKQPLQRVHNYNGKTYVLGHALFNQRLYDMNPNYCLEDYFRETEYSDRRRMANQVLWFRKGEDDYHLWEMPRADKIMVIGHTREEKVRGKNLDLSDSYGRAIKVHCVDGGISYDGGMLKYDGGSNVVWTVPGYHNNTSGGSSSTNVVGNSEVLFQDYILDKVLKEGKLGIHKAVFDMVPSEINSDEVNRIVSREFGHLCGQDFTLMRSLYVKTFLLDYILECQLERMHPKYGSAKDTMFETSSWFDIFFNGSDDPKYSGFKGDYYIITSNRNARDIAMAMGPAAMEDVLQVHGCGTVDEYMSLKFAADSRGKYFVKK